MRVHHRFLVLACLLTVSSAPAARAAQRIEVVDVPSLAGNVDLKFARVNKIAKLQARVLLPDGYDEQPGRRWPVLYLLHGLDDNSSTWLDRRKGDAATYARGLPAIVVMPEGGHGFFTDAWLGGSRTGINWERYFLDEVLPATEARYRIAPGRGNHSIAGLSMGAYGALLLGAELPSYFGTALSYSGIYDIEEPLAATFVPLLGMFSYTRLWGRYGGPYAQAHSPLRLTGNLHATRLYASAGDGLWAPDVPFDIGAQTAGAQSEFSSLVDAARFAYEARARGVSVTLRIHSAGVHSWPYWRRQLSSSIGWGLFGEPAGDRAAAERTHFSYRTMAPHGNAWGLGFRFSALPTDQMILTRSGQHLKATGVGEITISPGAADGDATGAGTRPDCTFTATLPVERELPAGC